MSWTSITYLLLLLAVAVGFAWYERRRPPAKVVAAVAALVALAVIGRIAFAPLPNLKPTTDIVLLSGYALGGAPGFAVGALSAVVSNLFFGQGPWTPWQMAAWGGVGVAGGAIGALVRRRSARAAGAPRELGRWSLALACGLAGLCFGALMDVYQTTLAAEPNLRTYLAVAITSLPFNLAHAIGNVVFCLALGPPLVRALRRHRRRLEARWAPPASALPALPEASGPARATVTAAALLAAGALVALAAAPTPARADSASARAARYLAGAQNRDGGFGAAPRQASSQLFTGWAALGLAAAGRNPRAVRHGGRSIVGYMRARVRSLRDTGELERTILVLRAAGGSGRRLGGRDLRAELLRRRRGDGSFEGSVVLTAFGVMALRASGDGPGAGLVEGSARWLAGQQNADGGFGFTTRAVSEADVTGAALQALAVAGLGGSDDARRAVAYLDRTQNADGGFSSFHSHGSNAQSTAWAVQGLVAAGRSPATLRRGARTPLSYLRSLQDPDGSIRYSRTGRQTPVWVTAQALTALRGKAFPLAPVRFRRRAARAAGGAADRGGRARSGASGPRHGRGRATASVRPHPVVRAGAGQRAARPPRGGQGDPRAAGIAAAGSLLSLALVEWRWRRGRRSRRRPGSGDRVLRG